MTDQAQKNSGKIVKFGVDQVVNPTPIWIKNIFRTILYLSGLWALLAPAMTHIDQAVLDEINRWLVVGNTGIHFTTKFFGWDYK